MKKVPLFLSETNLTEIRKNSSFCLDWNRTGMFDCVKWNHTVLPDVYLHAAMNSLAGEDQACAVYKKVKTFYMFIGFTTGQSHWIRRLRLVRDRW